MYQYKVFFYPTSLREIVRNNIEHSKHFKVKKHLDKFLYIIHHIYRLKQEFKEDYYNEHGIHINCEVLREIIAEKEDKPFRDALIEWKIITQYSESYQAEKYSMSYKLHPGVAGLEVNRNKHDIKRKNSWMTKLLYKQPDAGQLTSMEAYQMNVIDQLTFDEALFDYIREQYPGVIISKEDNNLETGVIPKALQCVFSIMDKHYRCLRSPTKNSRLYSPVVRLKREQRKYLMLDGKRFQLLDVKNAQIFLGYFAISNYIQKTAEGRIAEDEYPEDVRLFKQLSVKGKFYEYVAGKIGWDISAKEERRKFKDVFFTYAWYADLRPHNDNHIVAATFNKYFPNVSAIIKELKKHDSDAFPIQLQNMEAEIMLDVIGKTLMDNNIKFLTIHDAIMIKKDEDYTAIMEVMQNAFQEKYGAVPPIEVEAC